MAFRASLCSYLYDGTRLLSRTPITAERTDGTGDVVEVELEAWRHLRPRFQQILLSQLELIGLSVEYGNYIVKYQETSDKGYAVLGDGSRIEADLVVAADGIGTKSGQLLGHPLRARSSGSAVYRCAYPVEIVDDDPVLKEHFRLHENEGGVSEMWMG